MSERNSLGIAAAVFALSATWTLNAEAHIEMRTPTSRYGAEMKSRPCGRSGGLRTTKVTTFKPGETITVTWEETINHPGHYRISFDDDGEDGFVDPASFTDLNTAPSVLVDNIADKGGGMYSQTVTLPNVECTRCTLQLIQVMTDKPPYGDGNDLYYQCADIVLSRDDAGVAPVDSGTASAPDSSVIPRDPIDGSTGAADSPDSSAALGSRVPVSNAGNSCAIGAVPSSSGVSFSGGSVFAIAALGAAFVRRRAITKRPIIGTK